MQANTHGAISDPGRPRPQADESLTSADCREGEVQKGHGPRLRQEMVRKILATQQSFLKLIALRPCDDHRRMLSTGSGGLGKALLSIERALRLRLAWESKIRATPATLAQQSLSAAAEHALKAVQNCGAYVKPHSCSVFMPQSTYGVCLSSPTLNPQLSQPCSA